MHLRVYAGHHVFEIERSPLVVDDQDVGSHLFGDFAASDKAKPLLFHIPVAKAVGLTLGCRSATALAASLSPTEASTLSRLLRHQGLCAMSNWRCRSGPGYSANDAIIAEDDWRPVDTSIGVRNSRLSVIRRTHLTRQRVRRCRVMIEHSDYEALSRFT